MSNDPSNARIESSCSRLVRIGRQSRSMLPCLIRVQVIACPVGILATQIGSQRKARGTRGFDWLAICAFAIFFSVILMPGYLPALQLPTEATAVEPNGQEVDPNALVFAAMRELVWGKSFACSLRQQTVIGSEKTLALGDYWHAGQGSGQFKMTMRFTVNESVTELIQSSDGRAMRTYFGPSKPLRSVNIDRIRQSIGLFPRRDADSDVQTLYLAVGGVAEVMRTLYNRYRWSEVYAGWIQEESVWQLIGTLRTEPPRIAGLTQVDQENYSSAASPMVPTDVRLTLHRSDTAKFIPIRIEYFRREELEDAELEKTRSTLLPVSTIEYRELTLPFETASEMFRYTGLEDADQILDETANFLPPTFVADNGPR